MKKQILLSLVLLISYPNVMASEYRKSQDQSLIAWALALPMLLITVTPSSAQSQTNDYYRCNREYKIPQELCLPCDAGEGYYGVSLYQSPSLLLATISRSIRRRNYQNEAEAKEKMKKMKNSSDPEDRLYACALEIFFRPSSSFRDITFHNEYESSEWLKSGYYGYSQKWKGCPSEICPLVPKTFSLPKGCRSKNCLTLKDITKPKKNFGKKGRFPKSKHSYKKNFDKNRGGRKR